MKTTTIKNYTVELYNSEQHRYTNSVEILSDSKDNAINCVNEHAIYTKMRVSNIDDVDDITEHFSDIEYQAKTHGFDFDMLSDDVDKQYDVFIEQQEQKQQQKQIRLEDKYMPKLLQIVENTKKQCSTFLDEGCHRSMFDYYIKKYNNIEYIQNKCFFANLAEKSGFFRVIKRHRNGDERVVSNHLFILKKNKSKSQATA